MKNQVDNKLSFEDWVEIEIQQNREWYFDTIYPDTVTEYIAQEFPGLEEYLTVEEVSYEDLNNYRASVDITRYGLSRITAYVRNTLDTVKNSRPIKVTRGRNGLDTWHMFNVYSTEGIYCEVQDNYYSIAINNRLSELIDVITDRAQEIYEQIQEELPNIIKKVCDYDDSFFRESYQDYLDSNY